MFDISELANGLKVVTVQMKNMNSVSVGMWVKAGGRYESDSIAGISHFIEHLVFKGTKKRNVKKIKETIEGRGGMLNAFTSEEATCFFVKILKDHLSVAIDLTCDLVYNPLFRKQDIDMERTVILEEIKMYMDLPGQYVHDLLNELMWPKHPLGHSVLGTPESVSAMTRRDIIAYTRGLYSNKNLVMMVTGDVDHDAVVREVKRFVPRQRTGERSSYRRAVVNQKAPRIRFFDKETEQSHFVLGYHTCSRKDERRYILALLNIILGANMSSRLFEEVREKRGLAYEIRSSLSLYQDAGAFCIAAGVENGKAQKAMTVIMRELKKICEKRVSKGELRRAKDYYLGQLLLHFEGTMDNMLWYGEKLLYLKKHEVPSIDAIRCRIESITDEDIMNMASEVFTARRSNFVSIGNMAAKEKAAIESMLTE